MQIRLDGRTALITGASLGLGRAMAERFAASGANVIMLARRADVLMAARDAVRNHAAAAAAGGEVQKARGGVQQQAAARGGNDVPRIEAYACDVADAGAIADVWARCSADFPAVDIVVNNAGKQAHGAFESLTDEDWQSDLDLKLFAAIRLTRLAWPGMKARGWGRVLNLLNTAAKAPPPRSAPTSVSRAAGLALTKVLAGEGAPHGICVNALMIGRIKSNQWDSRWEASGKAIDHDAFYAAMGKDLPMGRVGEAEECANLACFLVSDAASYVTGCAINMDGGLSPVA